MPAYNFKHEFALLVESGKKRQTIRKKRKRPTKPGDILYLKEGMRTKKCRDLLPPQVCEDVIPIRIGLLWMWFLKPQIVLSQGLENQLAHDDGFESVDDFVNFFKKQYGLPFEGEIIKW